MATGNRHNGPLGFQRSLGAGGAYGAAAAILVFLSSALPCAADWWSEGNLVQRAQQWLADAPADPRLAAERLAELAPADEQAATARAQSVLALLAAEAAFPDALRRVLDEGGQALAINTLLARAGGPVTPVLLKLLTDRANTPAAVRARCADVLQTHAAPEVRRTLVDCLLADEDADVQMICAPAVRQVPWTASLEQALLARVRSPQMGSDARLVLLEVLGEVGSDAVIEYLIGQAKNVLTSQPPPEPDYRDAVLEAFAHTSLALRRRAPQGTLAAKVLEATRQFWDLRKDDAGPEAAALCLIWVRLDPARFQREMAARLAPPTFWAAAIEKRGLRMWCRVADEFWPWPAEERRRTVDILLALGRGLHGQSQTQNEIGDELNRSFREWSTSAAVAALASAELDDRSRAYRVLAAVGADAPSDEAVAALQHVAFALPDVKARQALRQAGQAPAAAAHAARQLAATADRGAELLPCLDAPVEALRRAAAERLLTQGQDDVLWQMSRVAPAPYRTRARRALAERGQIEPALEWANDTPATFLDALVDWTARGRPEQSAGAARLLLWLSDERFATAPLGAVQALFPQGQPDAELLSAAWKSLRQAAGPRRGEFERTITAVLTAEPSPRGDALVKMLSEQTTTKWQPHLDDYRRRAASSSTRPTSPGDR